MGEIIEIPIYFSDLNAEAQHRMTSDLKTTPADENWDMDIVPLFVFQREVETNDDDDDVA